MLRLLHSSISPRQTKRDPIVQRATKEWPDHGGLCPSSAGIVVGSGDTRQKRTQEGQSDDRGLEIVGSASEHERGSRPIDRVYAQAKSKLESRKCDDREGKEVEWAPEEWPNGRSRVRKLE